MQNKLIHLIGLTGREALCKGKGETTTEHLWVTCQTCADLHNLIVEIGQIDEQPSEDS